MNKLTNEQPYLNNLMCLHIKIEEHFQEGLYKLKIELDSVFDQLKKNSILKQSDGIASRLLPCDIVESTFKFSDQDKYPVIHACLRM